MRFLYMIPALWLLASCGVKNNVTLNTTNYDCPNNANNASYCMAVQINNNVGGQNTISSTNFPIKNLSLNITGNNASNILSPIINTTYDPNNCMTSTINAGSSCTFYLQLNGESLSPLASSQANIKLNFNFSNTISGGGPAGSSSTTVNQTSAVYVLTRLGYYWSSYTPNSIFQSMGLFGVGGGLNSFAVENNTYGMMYFGSNNGVNLFGGYSSESIPSPANNISNAVIGYSSIFYAISSGQYASNIYYTNTKGSNYSWVSASSVSGSVVNNSAFISNTVSRLSANNGAIPAINGINLFMLSNNASQVFYCPIALYESTSVSSATIGTCVAVANPSDVALVNIAPIGNNLATIATKDVLRNKLNVLKTYDVTSLSTNVLQDIVDTSLRQISQVSLMTSGNNGSILFAVGQIDGGTSTNDVVMVNSYTPNIFTPVTNLGMVSGSIISAINYTKSTLSLLVLNAGTYSLNTYQINTSTGVATLTNSLAIPGVLPYGDSVLGLSVISQLNGI